VTLAVGSTLGPYEILAPLGAGGMGEVYRAKDARLGREVAVKVVPERLASDPDLLSRFEREARAIAALSHPNIVTIHDVGRDREISYAVTELLEGDTLRVRIAQSALSWQKAVGIAVSVADALAAAHSRGIVHRDVKADNVFLTLDGRVKLLDFGLARWKPSFLEAGVTSVPTAVAQTEPGLVLGTVGYMSPEQVRGEPADVASDIFSLGCLLYELVVGRSPFPGRTGAEIMASTLRDEAPALSEASPETPPDLTRIVAHCLEKNPEERFQSARDLAYDLRAVLAASAGPRASSGKGRTAIDSLAVLPFANASGDAEAEYLSDGLTETIIGKLSRLPNLRVMARSTVFRFKGKDVDPLAAGRELKVRVVLTGRLLKRGESLVVRSELVDLADGSQLWAGQYSQPLSELVALEEEIAGQISENLRPKLTGEQKERVARRYTESAEAYRLYLQGRFFWNKRTADGMRRGIEYFRQAIEADPSYALAYVGLADAYDVLGFYTVLAPREAFPKAKAAALRALEIDPDLAEARAPLAYAKHYFDWDWAGAEEEYRKTIALQPNYSIAHLYYTNLLTTRGRFEEAQAAARRAQELDPLSLIITHTPGWIDYFARRYDEAIAEIKKTIEMDPTFVVSHWYMSLCYERKGMDREALTAIEEAVRFSGGEPLFLSALGRIHATFGRRAEAEATLARLEEMAGGRYVSPYYVAAIHAALGETDAAFARHEKALEERSHGLTFLLVDPGVDPLRSDPRFDDLLRRVGLPKDRR
jgi:serine/threonine protein kinase/tetratricopeptide (TPR) repeat protein